MPMASDCSMAGISRLQMDAATITPAAKPASERSIRSPRDFFIKNTQAEPSAVPKKGIKIPRKVSIRLTVFALIVIYFSEIRPRPGIRDVPLSMGLYRRRWYNRCLLYTSLKSPGFMRVCAGCANRNEATANVDPENEKELMEAIAELTHDKTVIMIAHRLKTVRHADQIFVVDHGEIVQQGTHGELVAVDGLYHRFVAERQQAAGWKV